jgi:site-specific recombinase XerD
LAKKLPEKAITTDVKFSELATDALLYTLEAKGERAKHDLEFKPGFIGPDFNDRVARTVKKADIQTWLLDQMDEQEWAPATRNRYQAAFSLIFRVGVDNGKIALNPASRIKRKAEDNEIIRYLTKEEEGASWP